MPPSSIEVRSTRAPLCWSSSLPTGVDPVNDSLRSRGSASSAAVTAAASLLVITVRTPAGSAGLARQLAQHQGGQRGQLGRFEHGGAACGQGGGGLAGGHGQRHVPRSDQQAGPDRFGDGDDVTPAVGEGVLRPLRRTASSAYQRK